jgi:hypothetical protein
LKRRKIGGGELLDNDTDNIKLEEEVSSSSPSPAKTLNQWIYELFFGSNPQPADKSQTQPADNTHNQLGGKRKTKKRQSKRTKLQQKR